MLKKLLLICIFTTMLFGAGSKDDPEPAWNTQTVKLVFDDTYTEKGIILIEIEVEIKDIDNNVIDTQRLVNREGIKPVGKAYEIPLYGYLEQLPNNQLYCSRIRVASSEGNVSDWSAELWFVKAWAEIHTPGGCAILR